MKAPLILTPRTKAIRVVADGDKVILITNGRVTARMPWQSALELSKAIYQVAKGAEEQAKALQIAHDNAILLNQGFPVGLSNRRDIQAESVREARHMPGGIKSQSVVGTPAVIKHPPPKGETDGKET